MGYFSSLFSPNPSWVFAAKKPHFLVSSDHRSQSHLKFQSCLTTEYAGDCFWMSEENFSWNPPKQHVFFFKVSDPKTQIFSAILQLWSWRVFSHSNSPHRALGRYRHTSSSRQFRNIFCWLEILNYCPDGGNGNFHCSSSFLKATSHLLLTPEIYSLVSLVIRISRGANNCVQRVFEKNIYFIMIFPPILNSYYPMKG